MMERRASHPSGTMVAGRGRPALHRFFFLFQSLAEFAYFFGLKSSDAEFMQ